MKKITSFFLLILIFLPNLCLADGMVIEPHMGQWKPIKENQQVAVINYQDGMEHLIISVDFDMHEKENAVWIFPVPAEPEKVAIDVLPDFPNLQGYDIKKRAELDVEKLTTSSIMTQIYPLLFTTRVISSRIYTGTISEKLSSGVHDLSEEGIVVHEHIEKEGFTTELITASTGSSLYNYLDNHGFDIPENSISVLNHYIGRDYTFVVSWITPKENQNRIYCESPRPQICAEYYSPVCGSDGRKYSNKCFACANENVVWYTKGDCHNKLDPYLRRRSPGVFISFPTSRIYYPMMPTSIYGSERIPITIYVLDYVTPRLNREIKSYTETSYYYQKYPSKILHSKIFYGSSYEDIKYTKIEINAPSKYLTQDIYFNKQIPSSVILATFLHKSITEHRIISTISFILLLSFLAGGITGLLVFGDFKNFAILGLANIFTIIGLIMAIIFARTSKKGEEMVKKLRKSGLIVITTDKRKIYFTILFSAFFILLSFLSFQFLTMLI